MPLGTEIFEIKSSVSNTRSMNAGSSVKIKIADLDEEGQIARVVKGGSGGAGNYRDKQLRILEKGIPGE